MQRRRGECILASLAGCGCMAALFLVGVVVAVYLWQTRKPVPPTRPRPAPTGRPGHRSVETRQAAVTGAPEPSQPPPAPPPAVSPVTLSVNGVQLGETRAQVETKLGPLQAGGLSSGGSPTYSWKQGQHSSRLIFAAPTKKATPVLVEFTQLPQVQVGSRLEAGQKADLPSLEKALGVRGEVIFGNEIDQQVRFVVRDQIFEISVHEGTYESFHLYRRQ